MKIIIKILKGFFKTILILVIFLLIASYGFKVKEYFEGRKYVAYWEKHPEKIESVAQNKAFTFEVLDKAIQENDLILFGESHGIKEAQLIDLQLVKYLSNKVGMRNHLVELDFSQAYFINEYLNNGNDTLINFALKNWVILLGRNNIDYYNKWKELKQFNANLPEDKKLNIIGIDKIYDFENTRVHLNLLLDKVNATTHLPKQDSMLIKWAKTDMIKHIEKIDTLNNMELIQDLQFIQKNIANHKEKNRPEFMFANFKELYQRYNLEGEKCMVILGLLM